MRLSTRIAGYFTPGAFSKQIGREVPMRRGELRGTCRIVGVSIIDGAAIVSFDVDDLPAGLGLTATIDGDYRVVFAEVHPSPRL